MLQNIFFRKLFPVVLSFGIAGCAPTIKHDAVAPLATFSKEPQIVAVGGDGGDVYVAWFEDTTVKFARAEMGSLLEPSISPMPGLASSGQLFEGPGLSAWGGGVYLAARGVGATDDVRVVASDDWGVTFGTPVNVSNANRKSESVRVAASGDTVSVAWLSISGPAGQQVASAMVASSGNRGQTFGAPKDLTGPMSITGNVRVAAKGARVYVLYCRAPVGSTNADLFITISDDGGTEFGAPFLVSDNVGLCGNNHLLVVGTKVYVIWLGRTADNQNGIFVRVSTDEGVSFKPEVDVSNTRRRAVRGRLAAVGSNVYITWDQQVTTPTGGTSTDVFFSRSLDDGTTFSPPVNLSEGNFDDLSEEPAIAASGSHVHVLWADAGAGSFDIFYRRSTDQGATFLPYRLLPVPLSNPLGEGAVEAVARGRDIYATWVRQQDNSANSEVYYYSNRSCPILPQESGLFVCLLCCP